MANLGVVLLGAAKRLLSHAAYGGVLADEAVSHSQQTAPI